MKHKLLLLLMVLSITGCSLQELRHEDRPAASRAFGIVEAKEFFEKDHMGLLTRSHAGETTGKIVGMTVGTTMIIAIWI